MRGLDPIFGDWTYVYNATTQRLDQIESTGGGTILTYGYDARGRATARALTGTSQTFTVDLADRVKEVTDVKGSTPAIVATYHYDGHGRRTSVAENSTTTVQVYSQAGQLMLQSGSAGDGIFRSGFQTSDTPYPASGSGSTRYVYLGRHLIAEDGNTGRKYIHTDGLGSPVRTTNASGTPSTREDYKPYGWGGPTQSAPGFTGHVADAKTGLIYMQARYYDPYVGRFMAVDPVAATQKSFNRYWYANNNPYTNIDPDGREGCAVSRIGAVCDQAAMSGAMRIVGGAAVRTPQASLENVRDMAYAPWGGWDSFKDSVECIWGCGLPGDGSLDAQLAAFPIVVIPARSGITVLQREGNDIMGSFQVARGEARFVTELVRNGDTLVLRGTHIEGQGTLKEALNAAKSLGRQMGAKKVIIESGRRSNGARPGHIPRTIELETGL